MHYLKLISCIFILSGFTCHKTAQTAAHQPLLSAAPPDTLPVPGAAQIAAYLPLLKGKRVAMVVNQTSLIGQTHLVDSLLQLGIQITTIFAPEHGFRGDHSAGAHVKNDVDAKTGIPITSLYGSNKKPAESIMRNLDVVVFDIQDVGVRFYTYISTMHYVMQPCAQYHVPFVVLDRPNPNGHYCDGPLLKPAFKSFVGMHPVPLVHGMTVGEFAEMIKGENWLETNDILQLTVIKVKNYTHKTLYQLPVRPSPNLPNMASVYLYPSLGLFEGTNVSLGRGTPAPFQQLGRPGNTEFTYSFVPENIPGVADNPKYEGKKCSGVQLGKLADSILQNPEINLHWLQYFYSTNKPENGEYFNAMFNKLAGNDKLKEQIINGMSETEIRQTWQADLEAYRQMRKKYLLYP